MSSPPILEDKHLDAASVFEPVALLREARRQKGLATVDVPPVCILDPDGDIVRRLKRSGEAKRLALAVLPHGPLYLSARGPRSPALSCVVGAPFAVLVAEELFACGCHTLISAASDIDTVVVDSLKALDPKRPLREADMPAAGPK